MKKLIMCDLDCTLLPIEQSKFDKMFYQDIVKIFLCMGMIAKRCSFTLREDLTRCILITEKRRMKKHFLKLR